MNGSRAHDYDEDTPSLVSIGSLPQITRYVRYRNRVCVDGRSRSSRRRFMCTTRCSVTDQANRSVSHMCWFGTFTELVPLLASARLSASNQEEGSDVVNSRNKIVGGTPTAASEIPFFVRGQYGCGATLIAPDVVLGAAHCLSKSVPELRESSRYLIRPSLTTSAIPHRLLRRASSSWRHVLQ
jgi:hypothetical protein